MSLHFTDYIDLNGTGEVMSFVTSYRLRSPTNRKKPLFSVRYFFSSYQQQQPEYSAVSVTGPRTCFLKNCTLKHFVSFAYSRFRLK